MNDRYHRAAKDGRLDLLKEAFKKDLNYRDDSGMTPTLWTAYHGNLEALMLCCKRGGDPQKCDYTGNSALHLAAQNGHLNCLTFLVQLNVNLWKLDNDYYNALMIAGNRDHNDCIRYLDDVMNKKKSANPKEVKKLEKEAKKEAERRIKEFSKLQDKQQRKMESYHNGTRRKSATVPEDIAAKPKRTSVTEISQTFSQVTKLPPGTPKLFATQRKTRNLEASNEFVVSTEGRKISQTLRGVPSEQVSSVMFIPKEGMDGDNGTSYSSGKRAQVRDIFPEVESENTGNIPRFNNAFRGNFNTANSMYSALSSAMPLDEVNEHAVFPSSNKPVLQPFEDTYSNSSNEEEQLDPLESFLDYLDLSGYYRLLKEEKMDLDALALCSKKDLRDIGIPFGDGMKIVSAMKSRKQESDSELTLF